MALNLYIYAIFHTTDAIKIASSLHKFRSCVNIRGLEMAWNMPANAVVHNGASIFMNRTLFHSSEVFKYP